VLFSVQVLNEGTTATVGRIRSKKEMMNQYKLIQNEYQH